MRQNVDYTYIVYDVIISKCLHLSFHVPDPRYMYTTIDAFKPFQFVLVFINFSELIASRYGIYIMITQLICNRVNSYRAKIEICIIFL